VSIVLAAIFVALGALHAHWAFGGLWPARDERALIDTVVGEPRRQRMPGRALSLAVAGLLLAAAAVVLLLDRPAGLPSRIAALPGFGLAFVLIARGVAGYLPAWRRAHPAEPFARLDRLAYSPLCLALGGGVLVLALQRWNAS
jgi:hypothetical protein